MVVVKSKIGNQAIIITKHTTRKHTRNQKHSATTTVAAEAAIAGQQSRDKMRDRNNKPLIEKSDSCKISQNPPLGDASVASLQFHSFL